MKTKTINSQYAYSENNIVSIKINKEKNEWLPINFQWVPIINLNNNFIKNQSK